MPIGFLLPLQNPYRGWKIHFLSIYLLSKAELKIPKGEVIPTSAYFYRTKITFVVKIAHSLLERINAILYSGHWVMPTQQIALSAILGAPVYDGSGALAGHVREVALSPREDAGNISELIIKTSEGDRLLPAKAVTGLDGRTVKAKSKADEWPPLVSSEGLLLLERDLLDQQIIDVKGRKVVRVNDV